MSAVLKHPASQQRTREVWERFRKLQAEHEIAANRLWAGTLATNFTDEELSLIPDLLCPMDHMLLRHVRDPNYKRKPGICKVR